MNKLHLLNTKVLDEVFTPAIAMSPLFDYIRPFTTVYCPFDKENSNIVRWLKGSKGCEVKFGHKDDGLDFFDLTFRDLQDVDYIISNPPYSIKDQVLQRLYELGKPFAMLLPLTSLEGIKRSKLFRRYGIEVLVIDRLINFIRPDKPNWKSNWFNVSWFCWKMLPNQLMFYHLGPNSTIASR
ncbi:MAG: tRNA (adenine-N(6)-)-methyltransferase [Gammaproteobacteria bacterium]|nr:tRNA (adenine-N(6)-)-methyltransferase [Gammaproteobacteria bacterium]